MHKTIYAHHMFNFLRSGSLESHCDSGCCKTVQNVNVGDTLEKTYGSGFLLKLSDGTFIRTHKYEVYRFPDDTVREEEMDVRGNVPYINGVRQEKTRK